MTESEIAKSLPPRKVCLSCNKEYPPEMIICPDDDTLLTPLLVDTLIGTTLADKYQILEKLGSGGMGLVYKAKHLLMKRLVAIKLMLPQFAASATALKRFRQEAQAASHLNHPNILKVYDFGVTPQGLPYLVMDLLEGTNLSAELTKHNYLPLERALKIFVQTCAALYHAHQKGVIHRDLKPGNIMLVDYDGQSDVVQIVDFGMAKILSEMDGENEELTKTGEVFGSPMYMSPEQCMGQKLDHRSDIYSMGCVLYEYAAGRPPFDGESFIQIIFAHINQEAAPFATDAVTRVLQSIIMKAIEKSPNDRFSDMDELKDQLAYCHALWTRDDIDDYSDYAKTIAPQIAATNIISLERSALDGDIDAQLDLAYLYSDEQSEHYNPQKCLEWVLKAASADHPTAQAFAGDCFSTGIGTTQDPHKAFYWYSKAALAGHGGAERSIGQMYQEGTVVAQDLDTALYWLRRSCEHDDIDSQLYLAECLSTGDVFESDLEEAARWYEAAAKLGSLEGQLALAYCYEYGTGVEQDPSLAVFWLQYAVEQNSPEAMKSLAEFYHHGEDIEKDDDEALRLMQEAANMGYGPALKWLGWWYSQGLVKLPIDQKRAVKYYKEAVEAGDNSAMYYMGWHYQHGAGVVQSDTAAAYWYKKGAKLEDIKCIAALGCCYRDGTGLRQDREQAYKLLRHAAGADDAQAQFDLAFMEREDGNEEMARHWLELAEANGLEEATQYLD